ncbi:MAG: hypothetical protein JWM45_637, partial [Pseudonocardiales bacterium]|nr:hypothetical protein [Pseudonocardiales bacterium]
MCDIAGWVSYDRVLRSEQATVDPLSAAYDRADRSCSAGPRPDQDLADRLPAAALDAPSLGLEPASRRRGSNPEHKPRLGWRAVTAIG